MSKNLSTKYQLAISDVIAAVQGKTFATRLDLYTAASQVEIQIDPGVGYDALVVFDAGGDITAIVGGKPERFSICRRDPRG